MPLYLECVINKCCRCPIVRPVQTLWRKVQHLVSTHLTMLTVYSQKCSNLKVHRYEPILNDPRDDVSFRDIQRDIASPISSQSPSVAQMSCRGLKSPAAANPHDQSITKKAKKIRDSWSLRSMLLSTSSRRSSLTSGRVFTK